MVAKRFFRRSSGVAVVLAFVVCFVGGAMAQAEAPAEKLDPQELIVGDWYELTVEKQREKEQLAGYLLEVTDDWLVVGKLTVNIDFHTDGIKRSMKKYYCWVPRSATKINNRISCSDDTYDQPFRGESPNLEQEGELVTIFGPRPIEMTAEVVGLTGNKLRIANERMVLQKGKSSFWSGLPIVGGCFSNDKYVARRVEEQISLQDILYIQKASPNELPAEEAEAVEPAAK